MTGSDPPTVDRDRRETLRALGGLPAAAALSGALSAEAIPGPLSLEPLTGGGRRRQSDREPLDVFPQSVASGDPASDGVVLWTRVDPGAYNPGAPLTLEVAPDDAFERDVIAWDVDTDGIPDRDHTVKVILDGEVSPDETYYYRFVYDGTPSRVGRFRTLPAAAAAPDAVRFAVLTCQDYRNGYYGAYHHVAETEVDYLVHLGDFIYEHGGPSPYEGRGIDLPSGRGIAMGLADYRQLYRTYRADRFLRAALERHPLIPTWDDHEVVNNRYWDYEEGRPRAGRGDHPRNDDAEFMRQLFADGIRAWWEYMPVRVQYDPAADSLLDRIRLWRTFRFGDLLTLVVTDERLFRSSPTGGAQVGLRVENASTDREPAETILGAEQRRWFMETVAEAGTAWTAWANEVLTMDVQADVGDGSLFNGDSWDGYEAERRLLMNHLADAGVENFVALTGDLHSALGGVLRTRYDETVDPADRVGVELMTPPVTSHNAQELFDLPDGDWAATLLEETLLDRNPHLSFFDSHHAGYAVVEFGPDACEYTAYAVDKTVDSADADRSVIAAYSVPAGRSALRQR